VLRAASTHRTPGALGHRGAIDVDARPHHLVLAGTAGSAGDRIGLFVPPASSSTTPRRPPGEVVGYFVLSRFSHRLTVLTMSPAGVSTHTTRYGLRMRLPSA
jgi:hypothetical protein